MGMDRKKWKKLLLKNLELLNGLCDGGQEQFVCMLHGNNNMKKSEKNFDLRSGILQKNSATTTIDSLNLTIEEETILRSTYPSSPPPLIEDNITVIKPNFPNSVTIKSSSSEESIIKAKPPPVKKMKKNPPIRQSSDSSGYDCDKEEEDHDQVNMIKIKKTKSEQELNTPEEIRRIEENVAQNDWLKAQQEQEEVELPSKE